MQKLIPKNEATLRAIMKLGNASLHDVEAIVGGLSEYGWWEEKNLRCAIGGFAVKKGGACDEFTRKETE